MKWTIDVKAGKNYREKHVYIPLWLSTDHVTCCCALTNICTLSHQLAQHPITIINRHQLESCHTMTRTMTTTPLHDSRHDTSRGTNDNNDDNSHVLEVKEGK